MKKLLFTCLLGVGSCISATSQQMLGVANSNYAGTGGIYINPASIAASPYVFYFQLSSPHLHLTNNYVHYKGSLSKAIKEGITSGDFTTIQSNLQERLNGKPKMASLGSELRGPSFMLALSPKHSVALTTRGRGVLQLNNVSEPILRLIKNGTDKLSLQNTPYQTTFATNANAYAEIGLTYARTIFDQNAHSLKGGITVKRLYGLFSAYAISPQFNYLVRQNGDSTYLDVKSLDLQYGSSGGALGKGWGLDLGITYEYRPHSEQYQLNSKNKYRYRIGVALLDLGRLSYSDPAQVTSYHLVWQNFTINISDLEEANVDNTEEVSNDVLDEQPNEQSTAFRAGLPTALNVNVDYRITGNLYANLTWIQGMRNRNAIAMRQNALVALTPRLETKLLEVSLPLSFQDNYSNFAAGFAFRFGAFFIGSDNLTGLLGLGKLHGINAYGGIYLPIIKAKKKEATTRKAGHPKQPE